MYNILYEFVKLLLFLFFRRTIFYILLFVGFWHGLGQYADWSIQSEALAEYECNPFKKITTKEFVTSKYFVCIWYIFDIYHDIIFSCLTMHSKLFSDFINSLWRQFFFLWIIFVFLAYGDRQDICPVVDNAATLEISKAVHEYFECNTFPS